MTPKQTLLNDCESEVGFLQTLSDARGAARATSGHAWAISRGRGSNLDTITVQPDTMRIISKRIIQGRDCQYPGIWRSRLTLRLSDHGLVEEFVDVRSKQQITPDICLVSLVLNHLQAQLELRFHSACLCR